MPGRRLAQNSMAGSVEFYGQKYASVAQCMKDNLVGMYTEADFKAGIAKVLFDKEHEDREVMVERARENERKAACILARWSGATEDEILDSNDSTVMGRVSWFDVSFEYVRHSTLDMFTICPNCGGAKITRIFCWLDLAKAYDNKDMCKSCEYGSSPAPNAAEKLQAALREVLGLEPIG